VKVRLGDVCIINPKSPGFEDNYKVSFIPMPKVGENGEFDSSEIRPYYEVKKGFTYFQDNDVLFAKITPCMENGKGAVAANMINGIGFGSTEFHVLRPLPEHMRSKWLYYLLSWSHFRVEAEKNMTGSAGQKRVPKSFLEEYRVFVPSLSEQEKMTAVLDRITTLISLRKQQLAKLDGMVKSRFVEMFGDPVTNSMGWPICELSEYIHFLTSGSRGWAQYFTDSGEYFITIKNVKNCRITLDNVQHVVPPNNAEAKRTKVQEGDLLISITADLGRTGVVKKEVADYGGYINQHLICIRLNQDAVRPLYVAYYMESEAGKSQFQAKNQSAVKAGLNFNSINSLRLMVPPIELQDKFISFVEQTDKSKLAIQQSLDKLETLKKALMQKYFG